jgi:hypothetical protein
MNDLIGRINNFIQKKLMNPDWSKIYGGEPERYKRLVSQIKKPSMPKTPKMHKGGDR